MKQHPVLQGIRVVDFGQYIAGPLTARLLADAGADVIHINRHDPSSARELIHSADVLIENFRPAVMDRRGLGSTQLCGDNPRLVYCSLPGFAEDDPRANLAAWEGVIGAATGTYRISGDADRPSFTSLPIASHFAAFQAAVAIVMALIARERDGLGQRISVPLFDAMFAAIGAHALQVNGAPAGNRPDDFWTGLFQCEDRRWVQVSAATPRFRTRLAKALGLHDWLEAGFFDVERLTTTPALRSALRERQQALFGSRSAQDWENLGGHIGVPITVCRSTAEWLATEHARASGIVRESDQLGPAVRLVGTSDTSAPATDAHSPTDPPLDGVRVLDVSQVLAGPTTGRTLAEYGADVVKLNNPREEGAGFHFSLHRYHTDVNRGKRSLLLDLKTAEGQSILTDLLMRSDVLIQNFRPDAAERLALSEPAVRSRQPGIAYVTISAFGQPGPWTGWPGYEVQAQAATGLRYAGEQRPAGQPFAVNDYGTGLLGAFGAGLAIFHRTRTGDALSAEAALVYTATTLQSAMLPLDQEALGWSPLQRLQRASDGWLFVGARPDQAAELPTDFAARSVEEWVRELTERGIGAHRLVRIDELMRDRWVIDHGLSLTRPHDTGEVITTVGPAARLSRTPVRPGRPTPSPGADAAEILRDLGREAQLPDLLAAGVVSIE